ncbi:dirigent protein 1-like [Salvia hispanica]|uniref:dirigent protein 1-like n=1 Tax=Salvia hispanica TaxID=49212 RepID=UPI002009A162|nr:dirigent protein 1-like [Salvia hispanica]
MTKAPTFSLIILLFLAISLPTKGDQLTHLHFYLHYILRGDTTAVVVAQAATTYTYEYKLGEVAAFDVPLTEGPNLSSRVVGRAQGMYADAAVSSARFFIVYNYFFTERRFKGSTLSVLGGFAPLSADREMPVVGGSGYFRLASGFVRLKTYSVDWEKGVIVDEHHVYANAFHP